MKPRLIDPSFRTVLKDMAAQHPGYDFWAFYFFNQLIVLRRHKIMGEWSMVNGAS